MDSIYWIRTGSNTPYWDFWSRKAFLETGLQSILFPGVYTFYHDGEGDEDWSFDGHQFRNSWRIALIGLQYLLTAECIIWLDESTGNVYLKDPRP